MKTKILIATGLFLLLFGQQSSAQDTKGFYDVKGMKFLNAGIGLGTFGLYGTGGLPVVASVEQGFTKNISAGIGLGFVQRKYATHWKYSYFLVGARGSYHLGEVLKITNESFDVYGGAGLFYRHYSHKYNGHDDEFDLNSSGGDVVFELHAGARYFFNEKIGGFAEVGYGFSPLQLGVTVKL